jgi:hypothetical protein
VSFGLYYRGGCVSFGLYYRPVPKEIPPAIYLPVQLKYVIARRFFDHDGSLRGQCILDKRHIPYLEGIADANKGEASEGAAELIKAIREHDIVELWIGDADD